MKNQARKSDESGRRRWTTRTASLLAVGMWLVITSWVMAGCSKPAQKPDQVAMVVVEGEAPMEVKTSLRGEVPIGLSTEIKLQITAAPELTWASTTVRGVKGISLTKGEPQAYEPGRDGRVQSRSVYVVAGLGSHGLVAVDVSWRRPGDNGTMSATLAFPIHAAGATLKTPPIGRLEKGPDGVPVQVMPSK